MLTNLVPISAKLGLTEWTLGVLYHATFTVTAETLLPLTDDADDADKTEFSHRAVDRRLSADVQSSVGHFGVLHVQHQHVVLAIRVEPVDVVRRRTVAFALGAGVQPTDGRRQR